MPNKLKPDLLKDSYQHKKANGTSENYQEGNVRGTVHFADYPGSAATSFYVVNLQEQVIRFLDTMIKTEQIDSDKKWITTSWNDYLCNLGALERFDIDKL